MIKISNDIDLRELAKKVYELSRPQGMGIIHFQPGGLSDVDAEAITNCGNKLNMDYVHGRACKFNVYEENGQRSIPDNWYDHTDAEYKELLNAFGIEIPSDKDHGISCACPDCEETRMRDGEKSILP